jgi:hypothetical protein
MAHKIGGTCGIKWIKRARLFEASYMLAQFRFFDLEDALGEG